jgi:peptidoglycan hydrolase CwlO-like protein
MERLFKISGLIFLLILFIIPFYVVYKEKSNNKPSFTIDMLTHQKKYDSLQNIIIILKDSISSYQNVIVNLNNFDDALIQQYKNSKEKIKQLNYELSKKSGSINTLDCSQLSIEITNRYDTTNR